ncbi:LicD family protein [Schaalia sp. lx-100]|uniref:LicD family protein n=1 Tax=Schaalia sp. lx-100 TaxID=2899081 RepID=UPI001E59B2A4|nr:LicD family protein [Schaalia sp. lx-100]MCD4557770.1 LicD family protein [Schaalia sp. lx-100]
MAYKQYDDPAVLRKLQVVSTLILEEFDRVCAQLHIPYFSYAGTAIGAIRHNGFIPWDDDIDVALFREDFERFLREAPAALGDAFELIDWHTDPHFPACNATLALKGTYCVPDEFMKCRFQYPISIGIYALDQVPRDPKVYRKQARRTWLWGRLSFLRATPHPHLSLQGPQLVAVRSACFITHWLMKLTGFSPAFIHQRWEKAARMAEHDTADEKTLYADYTDMNPLAWAVTKAEVFPLIEHTFENITVKLPHAYDTILRRGYGDYMQLPPEDNRKNHHPGRLDFGDYA